MGWTCSECRSEVEEAFEVCWNCGTSKEGVRDPNFGTSEEPPAPSPPAFPPAHAAGSQVVLGLGQVCALLSAVGSLFSLPVFTAAYGNALGIVATAMGVILALAMFIVFSRVMRMPPRG